MEYPHNLLFCDDTTVDISCRCLQL